MLRLGVRPRGYPLIWGVRRRFGNVTYRACLALSTYTDQGIRGCPVPNIKSQMKRVKTNEKSRQRNKAVKSALRTYVRNFRRAAEAGDVEVATKAAKIANRQLDKAVSKGVIHKNQAANRKSAISKKLNSLAA